MSKADFLLSEDKEDAEITRLNHLHHKRMVKWEKIFSNNKDD